MSRFISAHRGQNRVSAASSSGPVDLQKNAEMKIIALETYSALLKTIVSGTQVASDPFPERMSLVLAAAQLCQSTAHLARSQWATHGDAFAALIESSRIASQLCADACERSAPGSLERRPIDRAFQEAALACRRYGRACEVFLSAKALEYPTSD